MDGQMWKFNVVLLIFIWIDSMPSDVHVGEFKFWNDFIIIVHIIMFSQLHRLCCWVEENVKEEKEMEILWKSFEIKNKFDCFSNI